MESTDIEQHTLDIIGANLKQVLRPLEFNNFWNVLDGRHDHLFRVWFTITEVMYSMFRMRLRFGRKSGFMKLMKSGLWSSWIRSSSRVSLLILSVVEASGDFTQSMRELYWPIDS